VKTVYLFDVCGVNIEANRVFSFEWKKGFILTSTDGLTRYYKTFFSANKLQNKLECLSLASSSLIFASTAEPTRVKQLSGAPL
jgi:hypothetical protein